MTYFYAFIITGCICSLTQFLSELKVSFPIIAISLITIAGGICTKLGLIDILNSLSVGGVAVTAVGCGNGAYMAGAELMTTGNISPLICSALLNIVLVLMGSSCGILRRIAHKKTKK